MSEPYGYVWTSVKDGMEIRFTRMYPNEFYKPTDITPVYKTPQRTWVGLNDDDKKQIAKAANYNFEMTTGEYAERIGRLTEEKLKELNT